MVIAGFIVVGIALQLSLRLPVYPNMPQTFIGVIVVGIIVIAAAEPYAGKGRKIFAQHIAIAQFTQYGQRIGIAFGDLNRIGLPEFGAVRGTVDGLFGFHIQRGQHLGVLIHAAGKPQAAGIAAQSFQKLLHGLRAVNRFGNKAFGTGDADIGIVFGRGILQGAAILHHFAAVGKRGVILQDHGCEPYAVAALNRLTVFQIVGDV